MKSVILLSCLFAVSFSAPVHKKVYKLQANVPSLIEIEASDPDAAVRKARQLFDIDIDVYNNNGNGYFDNGDDFGYGGGGYGGGYGGYGGGYDGGYGGGYGGGYDGGYGGGYGGYGGGYGGYGGDYGGYGGYGGCSVCG